MYRPPKPRIKTYLSSCTEIPGTLTTDAATSESENRASNSTPMVSTMFEASRSLTSSPAGSKLATTNTSSISGAAICIASPSSSMTTDTDRVRPPTTRKLAACSATCIRYRPRGKVTVANPDASVTSESPEPAMKIDSSATGSPLCSTMMFRVPSATALRSATLSDCEYTSTKMDESSNRATTSTNCPTAALKRPVTVPSGEDTLMARRPLPDKSANSDPSWLVCPSTASPTVTVAPSTGAPSEKT